MYTLHSGCRGVAISWKIGKLSGNYCGRGYCVDRTVERVFFSHWLCHVIVLHIHVFHVCMRPCSTSECSCVVLCRFVCRWFDFGWIWYSNRFHTYQHTKRQLCVMDDFWATFEFNMYTDGFYFSICLYSLQTFKYTHFAKHRLSDHYDFGLCSTYTE